MQLGIQNPLELQWKRHPGEEFFVHIEEVQPRKNLLLLRESPKTWGRTKSDYIYFWWIQTQSFHIQYIRIWLGVCIDLFGFDWYAILHQDSAFGTMHYLAGRELLNTWMMYKSSLLCEDLLFRKRLESLCHHIFLLEFYHNQ